MKQEIKKIAIYGKGGIGKSTTSSNLAAALSYMGRRVAQIGCDPKADSVNTLVGGNFIPTVSEMVRDLGSSKNSVQKALFKGFNNIICVESGGPIPGQGCAGRGVLVALELIEKYKIFDYCSIDTVIYDVLGDIVCGGFAQPMRQGYAREIYIVTSGEYMSLYAANNIATSINYFATQGLKARIAGIICNKRNLENEEAILEDFAHKIKIPLIHFVPRSETVQKSEFQGKTVIEAFPESDQAEVYFELAYKILNNNYKLIPQPLQKQELIELLKKYTNSSQGYSYVR